MQKEEDTWDSKTHTVSHGLASPESRPQLKPFGNISKLCFCQIYCISMLVDGFNKLLHLFSIFLARYKEMSGGLKLSYSAVALYFGLIYIIIHSSIHVFNSVYFKFVSTVGSLISTELLLV